MKQRRFGRVRFEDQCLLEYGGRSLKGRLLNISLKGALVEFREETRLTPGDRWRLTFHLGNADFIMRFGVVVVHASDGNAGFSFVEADLNTMFHLRNLLEARLGDAERMGDERECRNEAESFRTVFGGGKA